MNSRVYEFVTGIETSVQPDPGTPTDPGDAVTFGWLGTEIQEVPAGTINGVNVTFTLANTPKAAASVRIYQNGLFLRQGTDYTISGLTITMTTAPATGQTLDAFYRY